MFRREELRESEGDEPLPEGDRCNNVVLTTHARAHIIIRDDDVDGTGAQPRFAITKGFRLQYRAAGTPGWADDFSIGESDHVCDVLPRKRGGSPSGRCVEY